MWYILAPFTFLDNPLGPCAVRLVDATLIFYVNIRNRSYARKVLMLYRCSPAIRMLASSYMCGVRCNVPSLPRISSHCEADVQMTLPKKTFVFPTKHDRVVFFFYFGKLFLSFFFFFRYRSVVVLCRQTNLMHV